MSSQNELFDWLWCPGHSAPSRGRRRRQRTEWRRHAGSASCSSTWAPARPPRELRRPTALPCRWGPWGQSQRRQRGRRSARTCSTSFPTSTTRSSPAATATRSSARPIWTRSRRAASPSTTAVKTPHPTPHPATRHHPLCLSLWRLRGRLRLTDLHAGADVDADGPTPVPERMLDQQRPVSVDTSLSVATSRQPSAPVRLDSGTPTFAHACGAAGYNPVLVGRMHSNGPDQLCASSAIRRLAGLEA